MDMKEVMEHVRGELREQPDSHFSEVYFRVVERGASSTNVHNALFEMLKRDEVKIKGGKQVATGCSRGKTTGVVKAPSLWWRSGFHLPPDTHYATALLWFGPS